MNWDGQNPTREHGEWLISCIEDAAKLGGTTPPFTFPEPRNFVSADGRISATVNGLADAIEQLRRLSQPFLNWSGKAERLSFSVPTLPLFVHERLSTQAIIETLKAHRKDATQANLFDLFGDPQRPLADAITKAYEYQDQWVNRLILGDSLVVMNSLVEFEGLSGEVQMIYIDPPYGVKFGSNFQPFVRRHRVSAGNDEDMTREIEMVRAYRDTWELGLHSYLAYLRDRLSLSRTLLSASGSIFVQISEENMHHVRELLDEIFGADNYVGTISYQKTTGASGNLLSSVSDYLLWYAKEKSQVYYTQLYLKKVPGEEGGSQYTWVEEPDGTRRNYGSADKLSDAPEGSRVFAHGDMTSQRPAGEGDVREYEFQGQKFRPGAGTFKTDKAGLDRLAAANRLLVLGNSLRYVRYLDDFPVFPVTNVWSDTGTSGFAAEKLYVVQTHPLAVQRCVLMTTRPGDLVLDPTCGSGTTPYVAEMWGRRWIAIDTSRVPLALTRQRLLAATYPYHVLTDGKRGPAGGFVYNRRRTKSGEEVGGIIPHITLASVAGEEPEKQEILADRPDAATNVTRVTGPFCVEATIPTPLDLDGDGEPDDGSDLEERGSFVDRMLDTLRRAPVLNLSGNRTVTLRNIRSPAKTLALSAEALVDGAVNTDKPTLGDAIIAADEASGAALPLTQAPVAIVFGPENGGVSERLVYEAAQEAAAKRYTHLYVIGFAIQPNAEQLIGQCEAIFDVPATWVAITPDVIMGDLLKTTRASQIFSIGGRPEIRLACLDQEQERVARRWQVHLAGLDTFDPVTMEVSRLAGNDVPCWLLDTDYNGRVFMASQAFFPRTKAWDSLKKALKATHEQSVWDHLAGDTSAPFEPGEHRTIAVKVIDDRGNELMAVRKLDEA